MAKSASGSSGDVAQRLTDLWADLMERLRAEPAEPSGVAATAIAAAPVVWLIGKVQSGKSSIVQAITGAGEAEVGSGYRACTRTSRVFEYPAAAPVIRFLDTRGLGEAGYDPGEDLAVAEAQAHLLLAVVRVSDHQQEAVLGAVQAVRQRHPGWPLVVALTALHDLYPPGMGHILPYPFDGSGSGVPERLSRSIARHRLAFAALPGNGPVRVVPIDFTRADDEMSPRHYGLEQLLAAISEVAPAAITATLAEMGDVRRRDAQGRALPTILGYAAAAAASDVVPLAGAVAVPGVQARLLYVLAAAEGVAWDRRMLGEFGACLGAGILTRMAAQLGIRQLVKLVPVYGQTVGAAAAAATSFATTYALGRAALVFLDQRRSGRRDDAAVGQAYREGLEKAFRLARERGLGEAAGKAGAPDAQR